MTSPLRLIKRTPLVRRICLLVFIYAATLTGLALFGLAFWQFQDKADALQACIAEQVDTFYGELSENIWRRDKEGIEEVLARVDKACHSAKEARPALFWELNLKEDNNWLQYGYSLQRWPIVTQSFPISYWEGKGVGQYGLGALDLRISMRPVYDELAFQAWSTLGLIILIMITSVLLALYLSYLWFVRRSREFMRQAISGEITDTVLRKIETEKSEIAELWRVLVRLRNDAERTQFELKQRLKQAKEGSDKFEEALSARNQFIARLSHELRTPMNGLIGFNSLLAQTPLNDDQIEYVATMQASLESLLHVINDVADLAKIESGELDVDSIPFSVRQVVSGVSGLLRVKADAKGVHLETRVSPDVPASLRGDPGRIRQILSNLVSNAINYTEQGHVLINVDLLSLGTEECRLRISVEDSGIPLRYRGRDTEQESRSDRAGFSAELRERRSISMDACEKLARLLGGEVDVDPVDPDDPEAAGATTWLQLSLPLAGEGAAGQQMDTMALANVLAVVIDPTELSRRITLELLERWSVDFEVEQDVSDALSRLPMYLDSKPYVLVLFDDRPRDYDAYNAVRKLKLQLEGRGAVIVLSSHPQLGDAERYFLAGASGFLSKLDRDPFLKDVMSQVYSEREYSIGRNKRLVTRYSVQDLNEHAYDMDSDRVRVLVVEDNIVNQQLLSRELDRKGCLVDVATNGFEAIELFKHNRYEFILMDCLMPDMDGYETSQILREIEISRKVDMETPIVALVGGYDDNEEDRCRRVGMTTLITKPIKITQLEMVLKRFIS